MRKKVLVLGAGGFIGSHLTVEMVKRGGFDITAVDISREKLAAGLDELHGGGDNEKYERIDHSLSFIHADIIKPDNDDRLRKLIDTHEIVINLVAVCTPSIYVKNPLHTFETTFSGNLKVAKMCAASGATLVQFSTSEVYGKSPAVYHPGETFPFNEETSNLILGPVTKQRWIYASAKQLLERVIHAYSLEKKLRFAIIRPFNYIGERIDNFPGDGNEKQKVFINFMNCLIHRKPLEVVNGGLQKRCYTYIEDATDAHMRILEGVDSTFKNQIINVGAPENETTIRGLAEMMARLYREKYAGSEEKISDIISVSGEEFYGEGYDDIDRRVPDTAKLRKRTGWRPKYDLPAMVDKIMGYYMDRWKKQKG